MTTEREGLTEEIAGVLAEHVRCDWSDRTYSCGGCANRFERETQAAWEVATTEERRAHHAELMAHQKPNWSLADYNAHLADALADLLAARDRRVRAEALRAAADEMVGRHGTNPAARFLRARADWIEADR